ncbi:MAG: YbjN domain-containing protein [Nocardioides sp.]|uniref:YbjN domain-containing protein n=1 Tax=Nocardioides sp. TaxID=35761 RepID=UPI003F1265B4
MDTDFSAQPSPEVAAAVVAVRAWLSDNDLAYEEQPGHVYSFALPGEKKLQVPVRLDVGPHTLGVHAFVCRNPDEDHLRVYRWLLERNLRMYAVAFAVDHDGDIYLDARLPLASVTAAELDQLMGSVLANADESFNAILELGFATSIRKEYEWRVSRGESLANLEAFRGWLDADAGRTPS